MSRDSFILFLNVPESRRPPILPYSAFQVILDMDVAEFDSQAEIEFHWIGQTCRTTRHSVEQVCLAMQGATAYENFACQLRFMRVGELSVIWGTFGGWDGARRV